MAGEERAVVPDQDHLILAITGDDAQLHCFVVCEECGAAVIVEMMAQHAKFHAVLRDHGID